MTLQQLLLNYLPIVAVVLITVSYIPQVRLTYGTKNVEGQSLSFWVLLNTSLFINTMRELMLFSVHGTYGGLLTQGINLFFGVTVMLGVIMYRKKD